MNKNLFKKASKISRSQVKKTAKSLQKADNECILADNVNMRDNMNKLIIAVDFDGVMCDVKFPNIGKPIDGAFEYVRKLHELGHDLILWTCRNNESLENAVIWLFRNDCLIFDAINKNTKTWLTRFPNFARDEVSAKVFADVYIDDKQIGGFTGWENAYNYITKLAKGD